MIFIFGWVNRLFLFLKKLVRLVLLGSAASAFCSGSYFCIGAEGEKKFMAVTAYIVLYSSDAGFSDHSFHCNRKRRMELQKNYRYILNQYEKDKNNGFYWSLRVMCLIFQD
jgi:hypothetical protein